MKARCNRDGCNQYALRGVKNHGMAWHVCKVHYFEHVQKQMRKEQKLLNVLLEKVS